MPAILTLKTTWGQEPLPAGGDGQLAYLRLEIGVEGAAAGAAATLPLNLTLVLDHSGSMGGPKLQHLKEAVGRVIDELTPQDTLSIVVFDEHAKVVVPSTRVTDKEALKAPVMAIREAGGTKMSSGLEQGLAEARHAAQPGTVSRILLLTDGQTWGDAADCARLAGEAGAAGIPISAFGVGADEDWSVSLLDTIAQHSNGQADYIADPAGMLASFRGTVQTMQNTAVNGALLTLQLAPDVTSRRIYRTTPMLGLVRPRDAGPGTVEVPVGDVPRDRPSTVLVELMVPPRKPGQYRIARASVRAAGEDETGVGSISQDVVLAFAAGARTQGDPQVMNLVEKATAFRLQTRALEEAEVGDAVAASHSLRSAATRLLSLGETDLAQAAETEAQRLEQRGQMSAAGTKKLTFATRKLTLDEALPGAASTAGAAPAESPAPSA